VSARPLPPPVNPALLQHAKQRRQSLENRIADRITRFAGSMQFVYLHVIWFAAWIGFRDQEAPRLDTVGERKHADTLAPRVARRHRQDR
jgi:hypothetical protein